MALVGDNDQFWRLHLRIAGQSDRPRDDRGRTPQVVEDVEVERFYTLETGWTAENPGSDKGAILEVVIRDWCANGWPCYPENKPSGYSAISIAEVSLAIARQGGVSAVLMLPPGDDFSDAALSGDTARPANHAVLIVEMTDETVTFVTWAEPQTVSRPWADAFFRAFYEVAPVRSVARRA